MMGPLLVSVAGVALGAELLDSLAAPACRPFGRSLRAAPFRILPCLSAFGAMLFVTGRCSAAAVLVLLLLALLVLGSNQKRKVLGEPLIFTDAAVIGAFFKHPRFYFTAIPPVARALLVMGLLLLTAGFAWQLGRTVMHGVAGDEAARRGAGAAIALLAWGAAIRLSRHGPGAYIMKVPDADGDLGRHGLIATLFLYWLRWRDELRRPVDALPQGERLNDESACPELVVIVQCESFADPCRLGLSPESQMLPVLERARGRALRSGRLAVSGFGAYTMRTEYGVLFGREEASLGFRALDPFLTAQSDRAWSLPATVKKRYSRRIFLHPHDLRFYARHRLMPAIGFSELVGRDAFSNADTVGPYVSDAALGRAVAGLVRATKEPTLIYAVTIENHGPWQANRVGEAQDALGAYLHHVAASDRLLGSLMTLLEQDGRSALLAFFGDHRPSIPGVVGPADSPAGQRDTPFVLMRFGDAPSPAAAPETLTPAELHHAILAEIGREVATGATDKRNPPDPAHPGAVAAPLDRAAP